LSTQRIAAFLPVKDVKIFAYSLANLLVPSKERLQNLRYGIPILGQNDENLSSRIIKYIAKQRLYVVICFQHAMLSLFGTALKRARTRRQRVVAKIVSVAILSKASCCNALIRGEHGTQATIVRLVQLSVFICVQVLKESPYESTKGGLGSSSPPHCILPG